MDKNIPRITVYAAVVKAGGRFLLARRPPGAHLEGQWEFPGGKPRESETPAECLARELREELNLEPKVLRPLGTVDHDYPDKHIRLQFFLCRADHPEKAAGLEDQQFGWFAWQKIPNLDLAPADRRFIEEIAGVEPPAE